MKSKKATVIFFEIAGKKKYVGELTIRPDNKIVPIYTDHQENAHQFEDEAHAQEKLSLFVNPNSHQFKMETIEIGNMKIAQFGSKVKDALV